MIGVGDPRGSLWRDLEDANRISLRQGGDRVDRDGDKFIQYAGVSTQYFAALIDALQQQLSMGTVLNIGPGEHDLAREITQPCRVANPARSFARAGVKK